MAITVTLTEEQIASLLHQILGSLAQQIPPEQRKGRAPITYKRVKDAKMTLRKRSTKRGNWKHLGLDEAILDFCNIDPHTGKEIAELVHGLKAFKGVPYGTVSSRLHYLGRQRLLSSEKELGKNYYSTTKRGAKYHAKSKAA